MQCPKLLGYCYLYGFLKLVPQLIFILSSPDFLLLGLWLSFICTQNHKSIAIMFSKYITLQSLNFSI